VPNTLAAMKSAFGSLVAISRATQAEVDTHATTVHAAVTSLGQDRDTTASKLATAAQVCTCIRCSALRLAMGGNRVCGLCCRGCCCRLCASCVKN